MLGRPLPVPPALPFLVEGLNRCRPPPVGHVACARKRKEEREHTDRPYQTSRPLPWVCLLGFPAPPACWRNIWRPATPCDCATKPVVPYLPHTCLWTGPYLPVHACPVVFSLPTHLGKRIFFCIYHSAVLWTCIYTFPITCLI